MKFVQSAQFQSRAAQINASAKFAHLLSQVILLPDTGIFNAAKLVALKEDNAEVLIAVATDASVYAMVMSPSAESMTFYDMESVMLAVTMKHQGKEVTTPEELIEAIGEVSSEMEIQFHQVTDTELKAVNGGEKREGVSLDFEEYFNALTDSSIILRIDTPFPEVYEGKKEEGVQA